MRVRYFIEYAMRRDTNGHAYFEPIGVWAHGPGLGLDIVMQYVPGNEDAQGIADGQNQAGVFSPAAREHDIGFHFYPFDQHGHFGSHGAVHTGQDVFGTGAFGNPGDRLGFGKHGAVRGKLHGIPGLQGKRADIVKTNVEDPGNYLQETSGSGGAFLAH